VRRPPFLTLALTAAALVGCGGDDERRDATRVRGDTLTVYVSLPAHGESADAGRATELGVQTALRDAGGEIDGKRVRLIVLPSTRPGDERWDPGTIEANAERAADDPTTIAYLGELDQGGSAVSLPVTNDAGILQVAPADGLTSLGRALPGEAQDKSQRYYPAGKITFGRLVPPDLDAARKIADSFEERGVRRLVILHEAGIAARELEHIVRVELTSASPSVDVTRLAVRHDKAEHVADLVARLIAAQPDAILYAGYAGRPARAVLGALADVTDAPVVGGPTLMAGRPFPRAPAGSCAWTGVPRERHLPPRGKRLFDRLAHHVEPHVATQTVLGYAAMGAVLEAIAKAGSDRRAVVRAARAKVDHDEVIVGHGLGNRAHVEELSTFCAPLVAH
jgi:branched-chain amino acid transport system substrate-binding protein